MKKTLLLLFTLLTLGVSGAWADDVTVTISNQTDLSGITNASQSEATATHKYGVFSGSDVADTPPYTTFTTNEESGLAGVTLSTTAKIIKPTYVGGTNVAHYGHLIAVNPDKADQAVYTFTIKAPNGYYIKSYTITALSTSDGAPFTMDFLDGSATYTAKGYLYKENRTVTCCSNTAGFTIQRATNNNANYLCIPNLTVTLSTVPTFDYDVSLNINSTTGALNNGDNSWSSTWTSSKTTPADLRLTAGYNNMIQTADYIDIHSATTPTYTITAPSGYVIAGYTIGVYAGSAGSRLTPSNYGAAILSTDSSNPTFVYVKDVNAKTATFTRTGTSADGYATTFTVYLKEAVKITYVIKNSGGTEIFRSGVVEMSPGSSITTLPSQYKRDFCTYNEISEIANEDKAVEFTATWEYPFEVFDTYNDINHWYDMSVRTTWYVTSDQTAGDGALSTVNANALGLATNPYQWAFVGNPYNLKLYNKDKGEDYVYAWTAAENQNIPTFVAAASGNAWTIRRSTATGYSNAFLLTIPDYGYQVNQFGGEGGSLKIWNSTGTNDAGSAFKVFDVPDDFAEYVTSEIAPYMENEAKYFNWTTSASTAIGYDPSYKSSCTYEKYARMKSALTSALGDLNSNVKFPESGYYRIRNRLTTGSYGYLGLNGGTTLKGNIANPNDVSTIIHLTKTDGKYYFQTQGKYTSNVRRDETATIVDGVPSEAFAIQAQAIGYASFRTWDDGPYSYYHAASEKSYNIVGWENSAHASQWAIEDATEVSIPLNYDGSAYSYGTMYLPFGVTLTGAKAYILSVSGEWAIPSEIAEVPANTPVLIRAVGEVTSATAFINDEATAVTTGNQLVGTFVDITTNRVDGSGEYILGQVDGYVGFYQRADGKKIGANKAYLSLGADLGSGAVKGIRWDFTNDINSLNSKSAASQRSIFNLAGQRMSKTAKGVNIVDGKKVVIK